MNGKQIIMTIATAFAVLTAIAAEPTVVNITDKVLVKDTERLGLHISADDPRDSILLKRRIQMNFEGDIRRLLVEGPGRQSEKDGLVVDGDVMNKQGKDSWVGATYTVLSGPDQWQQGKVTAVEEYKGAVKVGRGTSLLLKLDRPHIWHAQMNGLLLDKSDLSLGSKLGSKTLVQGDVPPGSFGNTAYKLEPAQGLLQLGSLHYTGAPLAYRSKVKFWAKAQSGKPTLTVEVEKSGRSEKVILDPEWKQFDLAFDLKFATTQAADGGKIVFRTAGGDVLLDDIDVRRDDGDKNPTVYRDLVVNALKQINPGCMRYMRNIRNTAMNSVLPPLMNYTYDGGRAWDDQVGSHEFFELCELLKCGAWATLPGTLNREDIDQFMEYLGAPADMGLGKVRAQLGHPQPWTKTLSAIYIQFGNEVRTFPGNGYNGPDYWTSLIERAKASPYYSSNLIFIVDLHGTSAATILDRNPNADRLTFNTYMMFSLARKQIQMAEDKPGFYDFAFAQSWHGWFEQQNNGTLGNIMEAHRRDVELSVYEGGNYHTTFSDPENPPADEVNHMICGMAGGLNTQNYSLMLMKYHGARTQNSFLFGQTSFKTGNGSFGNMGDTRIRVWGGAVGFSSSNTFRLRPRLLCMQAANRVMGGDLVETVHTGADPKFSVTNLFGTGYSQGRNPVEMTVSDIPRILSYAFKEGKRHGLILVSQDTREAQDVVIQFAGAVDGAQARVYQVAADDLEATNELDWAPDGPQVVMKESTLSGFASGQRLSLPKASITSIEWQEQ
jgi:hypothetical protein